VVRNVLNLARSPTTCVCVSRVPLEPVGFVVGAFSKRRQYPVHEYSITVMCQHYAAKLTVDKGIIFDSMVVTLVTLDILSV
jgi:hypothetical protein